MGMTTNNYAARLLPMVESCIPEDILSLVEERRSGK
jgi:hypothetical protein